MTTTPPPARPAGPTRRRGATRERLLDAAYETFAQVGVAQSSIEAICEAAGFTRGAFYSNFADKDDLIEAMLARESERVLAAIATVSRAELPGLTAEGVDESDLQRIIERFLRARLIGRDHYLLHTELTLDAARDPAGHEMFRRNSARQTELTTQALVQVLAQVGLEPTVAPADFTEVLYGIIERSIARAALERNADTDAMARRVLPVVVSALTRPARSS